MKSEIRSCSHELQLVVNLKKLKNLCMILRISVSGSLIISYGARSTAIVSSGLATFAKAELQEIPLKPTLKAGQQVVVPYVGMMYQGKVKKVSGTRVEVAIDQGVSKAPIVSSLGQVALALPPPK